ncbi:RDD family protein [Nocardia vinacea]|uniref:RDD family protein n=1 Tax=Nocardia vinacea TaxID=96468 RepID=UPI002E0EAA0B|nr:RDD family protein [Nocardia vinacea]
MSGLFGPRRREPAWVPPEADEGRLILAVFFDVVAAWGVGFAVVARLIPEGVAEPRFVPTGFGCTLAFSFVNHVVGTLAFRGSLGKLLLGLRVVRVVDGHRANSWQAVKRWLVGFVLMAVMALVEDGGGIGEACGVRTVRRRDQRRWDTDPVVSRPARR